MATGHSANNDWRSAYCREQMVAKLDEAILHATMPLPIIGDGRSMENHIFNRSNSYESYIKTIGKFVQGANDQRYGCEGGSYIGSTLVYPQQLGWQQQQSSTQMSNSPAAIQGRLMAIGTLERPKRPVLSQQDVSASSTTKQHGSTITKPICQQQQLEWEHQDPIMPMSPVAAEIYTRQVANDKLERHRQPMFNRSGLTKQDLVSIMETMNPEVRHRLSGMSQQGKHEFFVRCKHQRSSSNRGQHIANILDYLTPEKQHQLGATSPEEKRNLVTNEQNRESEDGEKVLCIRVAERNANGAEESLSCVGESTSTAIEVQTAQLQMLQKMSVVMAKVNEKIQLMADLHN